MQERETEDQQEGQRRDEHRHRPAHDPASEPGPRALHARHGRHASDREPIQVPTTENESGRQQGQRCGHGQTDDDRPGDAHRAQDHELEQDQPEEPQEHGQTAEEDRPPGGGHGDAHGFVDLVETAPGQFLAESAGHQQRVVHPEAEPEEGREVEHEDTHGRHARDHEDHRQGDDHGRTADDQRDARRHDRAEDEQQRQRREGQRDELAPTQVLLADGLHVAVEGGPTGEFHRQARRLPQPLAEDGQRLG